MVLEVEKVIRRKRVAGGQDTSLIGLASTCLAGCWFFQRSKPYKCVSAGFLGEKYTLLLGSLFLVFWFPGPIVLE